MRKILISKVMVSKLYFASALFTSQMAQMVKNLPIVKETQVQFLDQEDPLEKEIATHSSFFCLGIP